MNGSGIHVGVLTVQEMLVKGLDEFNNCANPFVGDPIRIYHGRFVAVLLKQVRQALDKEVEMFVGLLIW